MTKWVLVTVYLLSGAGLARGDEPQAAGPHQAAVLDRPHAETHPDLLVEAESIVPLRQRDRGDGLCTTVFGYLPYWESSANIRWDLLTHLACFAVDVNANGTLGNTHGWPWTSVVNTAHANGVKAILVVTLFDSADILTLITNQTYTNSFKVNIRNAMLAGNADGLNIDFEGGSAWRPYINGFMAELTTYLHGEIPGCEVTFAGPSVDWGGWDLGGLAESCDGVFIMGYSYYYGGSYTSGPCSPLIGGTYNLTNTVYNQYAEATVNAPEKLILGVPYYGHHWTTVSSSAYSTTTDFIESTRYRTAQPEAEVYGTLWDSQSQTPWYRRYDGSDWHQVWFDNADSLSMKYALARQAGLGGVGMWAVGYDGTRDELWDQLEIDFVDRCCEAAVPTTGEVVFADDFDDGDSAGQWDLFTTSADYTAEFAFDYSGHGIPPAPNTAGGTTIGAKFTVNNNDGYTGTEALSAYPSGVVLADDTALRFDAWLNYNGGPGGGSGSTEFLTTGLGHAGNRVVWSNNAASDGYWFAVTGEGGAALDYRVHTGATLSATDSGVYVSYKQDSSDDYYQALFPGGVYESAGAPGKQWVEVELRRQLGHLEWRINGALIGKVEEPTGPAGTAMIGYMDIYSSIANPAVDNFVIIDNVRIERLPETDCNENGTLDVCEAISDGDFSGDGLVDLSDHAALYECLSGPG